MPYAALAWLTVGVHAAFILFVVLGGLLVRWRRWLALLHVPALLWGAFVEFSGRVCPLTPIEIRFRALAGAMGYPEGFIEHYVLLVMYPQGLTARIQYALGAFVLLINGATYLAVFGRPRGAGSRDQTARRPT